MRLVGERREMEFDGTEEATLHVTFAKRHFVIEVSLEDLEGQPWPYGLQAVANEMVQDLIGSYAIHIDEAE